MSYHTFKAAGQNFEIETKYQLIRPVGHGNHNSLVCYMLIYLNITRIFGAGAYGVVISAQEKEANKKVAIKKITKAFEDAIDAKRILREIKLMKKFSHENVSISLIFQIIHRLHSNYYGCRIIV